MPKFHFPIVDGYTIEDPVGLDLTTEEQARELAQAIARQISIDVGRAHGRSVIVVDEQGSQIYTAPITVSSDGDI
jgi:broad specificity phosphatase PhoE